MKIVAVTAGFPFGPGETFLLPELLELQQQGHTLTLVPLRTGGGVRSASVEPLLGCVRAEGLFSPTALAAAGGALLRAPGQVLGAAARGLAARTARGRATNVALLPKACSLARLAERVGADHLHAYWAAGPATAAMIASELTGISWSFTAHRWDIWENNLLVAKLRSARAARLISLDGRRMLEQVLRRDGVADPECGRLLAGTRVVHLGVLPPPVASPEPEDETILCPASLVPVKGHRDLVAAFRVVAARRPRARLLLAGEGPLRAALAAQVAEAGLAARVDFLGHLPHEELLALYGGRVRCVALASSTLSPGQHEGIPVALIEAMAHGIPVVATACGGTPELVGPDRGVLVPEGDVPALAEGMERLLASSAEWRRLGLAGRSFVEAEFHVRRTTAALVAMMQGRAELQTMRASP